MQVQPGNKMLMIFDLKGSSFRRQTIPKEVINDTSDDQLLTGSSYENDYRSQTSKMGAQFNPLNNLNNSLKVFFEKNSETLKDMDFLHLLNQYEDVFKIKINNYQRNMLIQTIEREVNFLEQNGLMDYSLLVGIELVR